MNSKRNAVVLTLLGVGGYTFVRVLTDYVLGEMDNATPSHEPYEVTRLQVDVSFGTVQVELDKERSGITITAPEGANFGGDVILQAIAETLGVEVEVINDHTYVLVATHSQLPELEEVAHILRAVLGVSIQEFLARYGGDAK